MMFRRIVTVIALCVPLVLACTLIEDFLESIAESALTNARDVLPAAARSMVQASKPETTFSDMLHREFQNTVDSPKTASEAAKVADHIRRLFGEHVRTYVFASDSRLLYPRIDENEAKDREAIVCAAWPLFLGTRQSRIPPQVISRSRQAFRRLYGAWNFLDLYDAGKVRWVCHYPPGCTRIIVLLFSGEVTDIPDIQAERVLIHVEIDEADVPVKSCDDACLDALPSEIPFAAIVDASGKTCATRGQRWFDERQLADVSMTDDVEVRASGFFFRTAIDSGKTRFLLLGSPVSFPANLPVWLRIAAAGIAIALAIGAALRLDSIVAGHKKLRITMGWQIALAFAFAGFVPFLALTNVGLFRVLSIDSFEREQWKNRMFRMLTELDRQYDSWVHGHQATCCEFGRDLVRAYPHRLVSDQLPSAVSEARAMLFSDARDPTGEITAHALRIASGTSSDRSAEQVTKFSKAFMRQLLEERGQLPQEASARPSLTFSIQDFFGQSNPMSATFKNIGRLVVTEFNDVRYMSFLQLYENRIGKLLGFLFMTFDSHSESLLFLDQRQRAYRSIGLPIHFVHLDPDHGHANDTPSIAVLRGALRRTLETQTPETALVEYSPYGECIAGTSKPHFLQGRYPIGLVSLSSIATEKRWLVAALAFAFFAGISMIVVIARLLRSSLLVPIGLLRDGARAIAHGGLDVRLPVDRLDELGVLSDAFNRMTQQLQERERMRRYMSKTLQKRLHDERGSAVGTTDKTAADNVPLITPRGGRIDVALLSSDIRGFTTLSELHPPDEIVDALNDYFTGMDQIIVAHDGDINKLIGDAILAVFHSIPGLPHPVERAARCGLAMRARLAELNGQRDGSGKFTIDNGVGVHFGTVVEGEIGVAGGRLDYTVMGTALAEVQAIEAESKLARSTKVLVSIAARAHLPAGFVTEMVDTAFEIVAPADEASK